MPPANGTTARAAKRSDLAACRLQTKGGNCSGCSLVEFSLIAPLLLLLIFAFVEFCQLFTKYMILTNALRIAARAAITQTSGCRSAAQAVFTRELNHFSFAGGAKLITTTKETVKGVEILNVTAEATITCLLCPKILGSPAGVVAFRATASFPLENPGVC